MADPQLITISSAQPPLRVTALRGQIAPYPTGGFGGWEKTQRPLRKALTVWQGADPFEQQFSIIFDGVADDRSVEPGCLTLEKLASSLTVGADPPVVTVDGAVVHPELDYVITALDWDADPIWSRRGYRIRQEVTVTVTEHVAGGALEELPAADRTRAKAAASQTSAAAAVGAGRTGSHPKTYVVHAGDTLSAIAARLLGSYKRWREIADLNGIRDPKALRIGMRLKLP